MIIFFEGMMLWFTTKNVADIVGQLRRYSAAQPVAVLECGNAEKTVKAIYKASRVQGKPKPPFETDGFIGKFLDLDVNVSDFVPEREIWMRDSKGNVVMKFSI